MTEKDPPIRMALRCARLLREGWHDQDELARRLGVTARAVRRYLAAVADEEDGFTVRSSNEFGRREYALRRARLGPERARDRYAVLALGMARRFFAAFDPGGVADLLEQVQLEFAGTEEEPGDLARRFVLARAPQPLPGRVRHVFDRVLEAVQESRVVDLRYRGRSGQTGDYVLRPFTLLLGELELAVVGASGEPSPERGWEPGDPVRTFALHRIEDIRLRKDRFEYPSRRAWNPESEYAASWGLRAGPAASVTVALHPGFEAVLADRRWHPSQQRLPPAADGWLRVGFEVYPDGEFQAWILSWGPWLRVESPAPLRDRTEGLRSAHPGALPPTPDDLYRIA